MNEYLCKLEEKVLVCSYRPALHVVMHSGNVWSATEFAVVSKGLITTNINYSEIFRSRNLFGGSSLGSLNHYFPTQPEDDTSMVDMGI